MKNIIFVFLLLLVHNSFAQTEIFGGANYAFVREHSLPQTQPTWGSQWGIGLTVHPVRKWQSVSLTFNGILTIKGYKQIVNETYRFELLYAALQILGNVKVSPQMRIQMGVELSDLQGSSVPNTTTNYRKKDIGLVAGIEVFSEKRVSLFTQGTLGLKPMIDYYEIDANGNFNGRILDVRNTCLTVGLKFKIYNEKYYVW
jgi:hypothetical protein